MKEANPQAAVDAGEIAAGDNKPANWARKFTSYNAERGRNGNYDVLTLHAYSQFPEALAEKANDYGRLKGVEGIAISEFGWSVGKPNRDMRGAGEYKCTTAKGQRRRLRNAVVAVRRHTHGVRWLAWLHGVDKVGHKEAKCLDDTGYYNRAIKDNVFSYGLYKRDRDGSLDELVARPILGAFRALAG